MKPLQLTHFVAASVLSYPEEGMRAMLPSLRAVTATLPNRFADPLGLTLSYLTETSLSTVAAHYVETFDLRRRCCLYLTYYTHGDTRRRGQALLRFRQCYQAAGLTVTNEELPDHLAVVLEFSASGYTKDAVDLLVAHRSGLDLLYRGLSGLRSPYAHAISAVRETLPSASPHDALAARQLAEQGPPIEQVGL
ncbi:nitrate reductase molybdenum cofactor assembly chaperone [Kibdelosporangium aridum]|uniref:Nitrate reductase molybdenum cofactor assembly chaperone n=1 Tax=Kibdelosporangium aridum TaxID=2030 RepID=A0A428ZDA6_KIBAR|nr:nitrate reductase molybdenum cofactor assembly chaperone [Kibdelosporangium aridum]RSM86062.1 nitrate reductase molybdenum cofactor assembly chaperone [Kibdelosporangium aridum]